MFPTSHRARGAFPVGSSPLGRDALRTSTGRLSWVGCLVAVALLVRALAAAPLPQALVLVGRAGPLLALVALPYVAAASLDAAGWQRVIAALGRDAPWAGLLRVRVAADAVTSSLPAGAAFAESLGPWLLARNAGVPVNDAVPAAAGRRWLVMRAHAAYLAAGALIGWRLLAAASPRLVGGPWLPWAALASAALPLAASLALEATLVRGSVAERLRTLLRRI